MAVTDEMIEAGCKVQHSPTMWGKAVKNPAMSSWVTSHREIMRRTLIAAMEVGYRDPSEVWEQYLEETPDAAQRSPQGALAFGYAAGRP